jgi:2,3-bisphosphoglycerate-dependent phosphoglycerate mutase
MSFVILVRHGESRWNLDNKFTGWVDVPLSEAGIHEALICSSKLEGLNFDIAYTSKLVRAQETLLLILSKQDCTGIFLHESKKRSKWSLHPKKFCDYEIPIYSDDALNERYYGKLQGMNKDEARKKFGKEKVFKWRRSWDIRPPQGECLKDTYERALPYFKKVIMPEIKKKKNILIAAHGNSLRAIIKYLDNISDEEIPHLELPTGQPIVYEFKNGKIKKETHKHSFNRPVNWVNEKIKNSFQ